MEGAGPTAVTLRDAGGPADQLGSASTYRPHLDGLRSVAVYLVVLFHAGIQRFSGGYIGVDVFFVLSGFLVTQLLLRDLSGGGSIRFGRFYARRFRRLLPAAFAALMGTALIMAAVDPTRALASIGSFKAAFLYSANWYFIRESTEYFGAEVAANPVLQFWSLAVEEQFYLLWPLALAGIFAVTRRLRDRQVLAVRSAVAIGALASLLWALYLRTGDPNRAYFGTDARAYQLLAGASLALVPGIFASLGRYRRAVRVVAPLAVVSLIVLATSLGGDDAILRGAAVTVVTVIALLALEASDGGVAQRVLSNPALVYLGTISYGTYLWHWPVIIVATEALDLDSSALALFACLVATGLASLSYQILERPVRESPLLDRHRLVVIGAGLAISVVSAVVLIPAVIESDSAAVTIAAPSASGGFTPLPDWLDTTAVFNEGFGVPLDAGGAAGVPTCVDADPERCTVVRGGGRHLLLMGDSNAQMMIPAFTKIAEDNDLTLSLSVAAGCPWQRGFFVVSSNEIRDKCRKVKEDAYGRVIPALDPDVVVVMNTSVITDRGPGDPEGEPLNPEIDQLTRSSMAELAVEGRQVVVLEPNPVAPIEYEPLKCLSTATVLEECRYVADIGPSWYELLTRDLAAGNDLVRSADFDRLVCPFAPICDPVVDGLVVRWDGQHLTTRYSASLAEPIADYFRANGLI